MLLPNEPRVADARQAMLTDRYLLPALEGLRSLFLQIRAVLDPTLAQRRPHLLGRPYPAGQSHTIAQHAQEMLRELDPAELSGRPAQGLAGLAAFLAHGGDARIVRGVLHGARFHAGLLLGTLYVDIAHDSAIPGGPAVALTPFRQAGLWPLRDHRHYALIARQSWQARVYPNHLLPTVAPYAPLLVLVPGGGIRFEPGPRYLLDLNQTGGFASAAKVLDEPALADDLFALLGGVLDRAGVATAADAAQGRATALTLCARYRDRGRRPGDAHERAALELLDRANGALRTLRVSV